MQIIEQYYAAFNRQDWEGMLNCLTDTVRHESNQGGTETGKEQFRKFLAKMDHAYQEQLRDFVFMSNATGDRVAAEFVVDGTYIESEPGLPPATGQKYSLPVGAFFEIKDGRIDRITNYYNLNKWIELVSA